MKRHNKHGGFSEMELRNCIFAGNKVDLMNMGAQEVSRCLIASGQFFEEGGNLKGDPGFVDIARRDYRLAENSPCRDWGKEPGDMRTGERDLDGKARYVGPIDLGAYEYGDTDE
jgi:hypothetical protein